MNRGRISKFCSVVIAGIIAISGFPSMVLADVINAPTYYSVQSDLNYEITTNITSSWINHESIDLVLTNTGSETIHNWYLTFNTPYSIDNIWNGTIYETDGNGTYTITSNGWNQDIHTGESVTVGITFSSDTEEELSVDPEWYLLNTQATVVDASQYTLEYTEYSAWETGFTGQLTLTPQVDCQHWELSFSSNRDITAVSSAVLISEGENNYAITHDENNMRLFAGTAYNFGIQGDNTEDPLELSNVELTAVDLAYHLTDDVDANGVSDYLDYIGGGSIINPTPTQTPIPTDIPTATPTEEPTGTPTEEPSCTPTPTAEPTPTSVEDPYFDLEDSDGDGLLDYQEIMYMTDPDNPDTDGDGLLDGDEINIGTSPNLPDTDGNGLIDFDEDCDGDGISNGGEYATGTCMFADDSDYDGINDYNEIYFYGIDPRHEDSDSDGIKDGDEVTLGLNPGSSDSDGDGITDDYVMFSQSLSMEPVADDHPHEITGVSISGSISGLITSNTTIEDTYNRDMYCTDVYGRVGVPINIESEGHFDSMILTINYDESALGDTNEADLGVLWYDEDTGFFITQEQAVVDTTNNVISVELNHFSTYVVVDLNKWNNHTITPLTSTTGPVRTVVWRTRGVYYADPVLETNSQGQLVLVGWANQTASPERYENTAWNQYLESHPNDVRVETVNMRYIRDSWGGLYYVYTWNLYTTETVDVDNDHDGVPDYFEINGIYPLNEAVDEDGEPTRYTSNVDSRDTDDDDVLDLEEYGDIYIVSKSVEDDSISVTIININGQEELDVNSRGYQILVNVVARFLEGGQSIAFCNPKSNPNNKDSDDDGYDDCEDAIPLVVNADMVYIFTSNDFYDQSLQREELYNNLGVSCILYKFDNANEFVSAWMGIGLHCSYYSLFNKQFGNRYYYNAKTVIISAHGNPTCIRLAKYYVRTDNSDLIGRGEYRLDYLFTDNEASRNSERTDIGTIVSLSDLEDKKIDSLNLYSCLCGADDGDCSCLACSFVINFDGIQKVIAADSTLFYYGTRFFFCSYYPDSSHILPDDQYLSISENADYYFNIGISRSYFHFDDYGEVNDNCGFLVFTKTVDTVEIVDLYEGDVVYGYLYTSESNAVDYSDGYIIYNNPISSYLGDRSYDPVIDLLG